MSPKQRESLGLTRCPQTPERTRGSQSTLGLPHCGTEQTPHIKGRVQISHHRWPCFYFPHKYDHCTVQTYARSHLFSKRTNGLKHSYPESSQQDIVSYLHKNKYGYSESRNTLKHHMLIILPCTAVTTASTFVSEHHSLPFRTWQGPSPTRVPHTVLLKLAARPQRLDRTLLMQWLLMWHFISNTKINWRNKLDMVSE